jgi:hypothetical protein
MIHDNLPEGPEWGPVAPSIGANLMEAGKRLDDLRAVATAYRYATAFTCDHFLSTEIAANALQRRHPELSRREVMNQVIELIAYASRAYGKWLNAAGSSKLAMNTLLGVDRFAWSEELRLRHLGIELPRSNGLRNNDCGQ